MIVDDTPANLQLLTKMLKHLNYRVKAFPNGKLALTAAKKEPPDIIILDINMPGMNGYEVCRSLKEDEELSEIPVIFLSALNDTFDKVKAFTMGAVDFISKPFQFEEVVARIENHLEIRQLQIEMKFHNENLKYLVREQVKEISESQLATILSMIKLAEYRDDDTGKHIDRIRMYCRMIAEELMDDESFEIEIDDFYIENIYHSSALHDIGKIAIKDKILLKPGKLTVEEMEVMKTHTLIGEQTLKDVQKNYSNNTFINLGIEIASSHHERWDGTGYPNHLKGEEIPLSARIMAVADVYDALRSKRVYKPPFSHSKSRQLILEGRGTQFDPRIVDIFMSMDHKFNQVQGNEN
jgi:putative two-component system response regulator